MSMWKVRQSALNYGIRKSTVAHWPPFTIINAMHACTYIILKCFTLERLKLASI